MYEFLSGGIMMACWTAAVFFLRFWRTTADRLFLLFAIAFTLMGFERLVLGLLNSPREDLLQVYILRLLSFLIIIAAIVDKNRSQKQRSPRIS